MGTACLFAQTQERPRPASALSPCRCVLERGLGSASWSLTDRPGLRGKSCRTVVYEAPACTRSVPASSTQSRASWPPVPAVWSQAPSRTHLSQLLHGTPGSSGSRVPRPKCGGALGGTCGLDDVAVTCVSYCSAGGDLCRVGGKRERLPTASLGWEGVTGRLGLAACGTA